MNCFFHSWSVWEKPVTTHTTVCYGAIGPLQRTILTQARYCLNCNKAQIKRLFP